MTDLPERPQSPDPEARAPDPQAPATVFSTLRLVNGFPAHMRHHIVATLKRLNDFLERYPTEKVDLALTRSHPDTPAQSLTLACTIAGYPPLTANARDANLDRGLAKVRDEMDRMLRVRKNRREELEHPRGRL